jgi:colanic acid/amylovoran biosynthesis glycosyltransferase
MPKSLKIIIFDGSFKTTPFINRLVKGLVLNQEVYILGFHEKISAPIAGVHYVSLGSNQRKLQFVMATLKLRLRTGDLKGLISAFGKLWSGKKQELQQENLDLILHKIKPDIIHLQWPSVIPWFEEVLLQQKIPVLLSQRGFHNNVRPFVDEANFEYLNKWYPKIAGFHSVSKAIAANGNRIWNAPKKIDHIIYTGLNLDEIPFSKNYNRSNPLKILSIGRGHWIKGYDYALQSCKILKEKGVPFKYTIIGGAGDEELQFLVDNLGLKNYVYLEKRKPQSEVFSLMQETSLLLLPSLEEGIPNVVVEAMAIGLPVISTNCGGVVDLISTEKEGWIVPTREPQAMAEAIEAFVNMPLQKIEEVRLAARKKVEQQHAEKQMIEGMEELYIQVLESNKPSVR